MTTVNRPLQCLGDFLSLLSRRVGHRVLPFAARYCRNPNVRKQRHGIRYHFDLRDRFQVSMFLGDYEEALSGLIARILPPGGVYIDIGAQVGYTAGDAANRVGAEGAILAIEPDPRAFASLKAHFDSMAADRRPRVVLTQAAVSDQRGTLRLTVAPTLGHSRVSAPDGFWPSEHHIETPVMPASEWIRESGIERVDMMKIDVEGHEFHVLRSLDDIMASMPPRCIVIERNAHLISLSPYTSRHLAAFFFHHGYRGCCLRTGRALDLAVIDQYHLDDFCFVREDVTPPEGFDIQPDPPLSREEIARLHREVMDPTLPEVKAGAIVAKVIAGWDLGACIEEGLGLLSAHPHLVDFRGHVAHWLRSAGRLEEARGQYRLITEANPSDQEARRLLEEI